MPAAGLELPALNQCGRRRRSAPWQTNHTPAEQGHPRAVVASRSLEIGDIDVEFVNTSRDMEALRQWAAVSDGLALRSEECDGAGPLIDRIKARIEQSRKTPPRALPIGINAWTLALLLGALCAEWGLRKRWGMT